VIPVDCLASVTGGDKFSQAAAILSWQMGGHFLRERGNFYPENVHGECPGHFRGKIFGKEFFEVSNFEGWRGGGFSRKKCSAGMSWGTVWDGCLSVVIQIYKTTCCSYNLGHQD